jgi:hypothetical protein
VHLASLCDEYGVLTLVLAWPSSSALAMVVAKAGTVSCLSFPERPEHVPRGFVSACNATRGRGKGVGVVGCAWDCGLPILWVGGWVGEGNVASHRRRPRRT